MAVITWLLNKFKRCPPYWKHCDHYGIDEEKVFINGCKRSTYYTRRTFYNICCRCSSKRVWAKS